MGGVLGTSSGRRRRLGDIVSWPAMSTSTLRVGCLADVVGVAGDGAEDAAGVLVEGEGGLAADADGGGVGSSGDGDEDADRLMAR